MHDLRFVHRVFNLFTNLGPKQKMCKLRFYICDTIYFGHYWSSKGPNKNLKILACVKINFLPKIL
jgi:hypothetical protein